MDGFFLAGTAALCWGMSVFLEKLGVTNADPMAGLWARCVGVLAGGLALTVFVPNLAQKVAAMGGRSFLLLASGGLMASILGQIFFYRALKAGDIGRVATVGGAWPLVAFFLSVLFLHEAPTLKKILGAALVISGAALLK
jgi:bacterial/archaeal transporter family protein